MYKIFNILILLLILFFYFSIYKYYSSSKNIQVKNYNRKNINKIINDKISNLKILPNDTINVIEFNNSFSNEMKILILTCYSSLTPCHNLIIRIRFPSSIIRRIRRRWCCARVQFILMTAILMIDI